MELSHLTPDILGLIFSYHSDGQSCADLWKCGDLKMRAKLRSGVTHFYWDCFRWEGLRYPTLVSELPNLRHLYFDSARAMFRNPTDWTNALHKLPRGLQTLHICSTDAHISLMNFAPDWTREYPSYIETKYERGLSRFIDLEALFPGLQELKLNVMARHPMAIRDLPGLPSSLTRLILPHIYVEEDSPPFMARLPRSLLELDCFLSFDEGCWTPEAWAQVDSLPQLTRITQLTSEDPMNCAHLPRTLEFVDLSAASLVASKELVSSLPPSLRAFTCAESDESGWETCLPPKLALLEVWNGSHRLDIGNLPRSLETLVMIVEVPHPSDDVDDATSSATTNDDPTASATSSGNATNFSLSSSPIAWPSTLTSLSIHASELTFTDIPLLPETLTELRLSLRSLATDLIPTNLLPPRLENLALQSSESAYDFKFSHPLPIHMKTLTLTCGSLDRNAFKMIPSSLTSLECNIIIELHGVEPIALPQSLTQLDVSTWDSNWMAAFPNKLTSLRISSLFGVRQQLESESDVFERFPTTLTKLEIMDLNLNETYNDELVVVLSASSFSSLAHLKHLNLPDKCVFPSAVLRNLRHGLTTLVMQLESVAEADAPFLPQSLTDINLGCDVSEPFMVKHWPMSASNGIINDSLRSAVKARWAPADDFEPVPSWTSPTIDL